MKRKILIITVAVALFAALTVLLSGCAGSSDPTEGKNVVTFVVNGGILSYGTSSTDGSINYAYHPSTYVKDPLGFPNYKISRNGYIFTGWYTSPDCKPNEKWNFDKTLDVEKLTLYAGWEIAIKYTYSVNYVDGDNTVSLGIYEVSAGEKFDDWRRFADNRENYTAYGYYSDPECTTPWNSSSTHPGGDVDLDIPVYVNYIEGNWKIVDSFEKLKSALDSGNVYLVADIDCGGAELHVSDDFNAIFEGNGFKVTNFTVPKTGSAVNPRCAIFRRLATGAEIRNVSFENVTYRFFGIADSASVKANVAALSVSLESGVTITNVSVKGRMETDYSGELSCLEKVYYYTDPEGEALLDGVTDFSAEIVVNKQS